MNFFARVRILICLFICCSSGFAAEKQDIHKLLDNLLPRNDELAGWFADGEPEAAVGEDLYLLINGGAEIYHEYGFKRAIFQRYTNEKVGALNLEIYEMDSPQATYGIYTFKTGNEGRSINTGREGWLESYFLNFWKAKFLVTITGLTPDTDMTENISKMAKVVASKISGPSEKPSLVSYLPLDNLLENGISYLKGNLALFNHYFFNTKNIFGFIDGVIGQYDDFSVFIFRYKNGEDARIWYELARSSLNQNTRFSDFFVRDTLFEMSDPDNRRLRIKPYQNLIMIVLGTTAKQADQLFRLIEGRINHNK
ncbi:MAG: hypothetical protein KAV45_12050 [Calditrichia bacterium]|nr:hypothetical protein [Calditrichia bacterium]